MRSRFPLDVGRTCDTLSTGESLACGPARVAWGADGGRQAGVDPSHPSPVGFQYMGQHYLKTRKPQRIERIKTKVAEMIERGVPISRLDHKCDRSNIPLDTLLLRIETLGYQKLCEIEMKLEQVNSSYDEAIGEAITEIAYFVGCSRIPIEEVIMMACEICPPPTDEPHEHRGSHADRLIAAQRQRNLLSAFHVLRYAVKPWDVDYEWSFLKTLSLLQLELLTTQLQNRFTLDTAKVLRWTPNEPTTN